MVGEVGVSYRILKELRVVVASHCGPVTDQALLQAYEALFADPDFQSDYGLLIDLREAVSRERSSTALRAIAELVRRYYAGKAEISRVAIVAPRDLSFGLARVYSAVTDSNLQEVEVFRTFEEASRWLGIDPSLLEEAISTEGFGESIGGIDRPGNP